MRQSGVALFHYIQLIYDRQEVRGFRIGNHLL